MVRHALIFQNKVVNVLDWDGETSWRPQKDHIAIPSDVANIGDTWDGKRFTVERTSISLDVYTPAEVEALIDGIDTLAKARAFLKVLVKYLAVKK